MLVTLFGMVMEVNLVQPSNALSPMVVTLLGMKIEVKSLRLENSPLAILVTPLGMVTEFEWVSLFPDFGNASPKILLQVE